MEGKLFRGAYGVAPELGHLTLVPDGRPCPCGKKGCWERYCSGTALATTAIELLARYPGASTLLARESAADSRKVTGRRVAAAARDGDPLAERAMADLARWLGQGLALVADLYDPEVVVIGGQAVAFWAALGSTVAFELATGVAAGLALFAAPAGACAPDGALWAAPAVPLLRRVANFAAS